MNDKSRKTLADGSPVTPDHRQVDPETGQQKGYVVLSQEERDKGFVRPVRHSYLHVGPPGPTYELRDLTDRERERFGDEFVKYELYPEGESSIGRYWTRDQLDRVEEGGCGGVTTMSESIAETYAREPGFYGGTFCAHCREHFPVGKDGEFVWLGTAGARVGT